MEPANLQRSDEAARRETCPLCGFAFDAKGQGCRPACPLAPACRLVCCPRCRYSFPLETALAARLRRLLGRRLRAKEN